ncbi:MAG: RidA family protein [Betaproteobacteria bacterium]
MGIQRIGTGARMSEAVVYNGICWLAGQVADDASQDIVGQTRQVLGAIDALLAQAGTSKAHLLAAQIFLTDMADFAGMNAVWDEWIKDDGKPARATVEAALARPGWKVEIVVTAAVPPG